MHNNTHDLLDGIAKRLASITLLAPLWNRNFRLLFSGQAISTLGDTFYIVALPWLILSNHGSTQELSIVLVAYGIPRIFTLLIGGTLSDRLRPQRVMLCVDTIRLVLMSWLTMLVAQGNVPFWQICLVSLLSGTFQGLFQPASFAILPDILSEEKFQAGNSLSSSFTQLASLLGPAIAGIVIAHVSISMAFAMDALSFLVSAVTLTFLWNLSGAIKKKSSSLSMEDAPAPDSFESSQESETVKHLLLHSRLLQCILIIMIFGSLSAACMEVALPLFVRNVLAGNAEEYGLLLAVLGAGALAGGLIAGGMGKLQRRGIVVLLSVLVQAGTMALVPFTGGIIGVSICLFIVGALIGFVNVLFFTLVQQQFPRHLLGRVTGVLMLASVGAYPLTVLLAGIITTHLGAPVMFLITGLGTAIATLFGLTQSAVRNA